MKVLKIILIFFGTLSVLVSCVYLFAYIDIIATYKGVQINNEALSLSRFFVQLSIIFGVVGVILVFVGIRIKKKGPVRRSVSP
jgi:TRAP-type C4-dicarboxylate transport system permease small subunit